MKKYARLFVALFAVALVVSCAKENVNVENPDFEPVTVYVTTGAVSQEIDASSSAVATRAEEHPWVTFELKSLYMLIPTDGVWEAFEIIHVENAGAPGGLSDRVYAFALTTQEDGSMLVTTGADDEFSAVVPAGAKVYFSNIDEVEVEDGLATAKTPMGNDTYKAFGHDLYKSKQTTLEIVDGNMKWFGKMYSETVPMEFYRMTGEFKACLYFYQLNAQEEPVTIGQDAFEATYGSLGEWTVTPYVVNYPYFFRLENNDNSGVSGVWSQTKLGVYQLSSAPLALGTKSFKLSVEGATADFENTVASVMEEGPYLFSCVYYGLGTTLQYFIEGPNDQKYMARVYLNGESMLPNEAKTFNVAINVDNLNENNLWVPETRAGEGKFIPAQLW